MSIIWKEIRKNGDSKISKKTFDIKSLQWSGFFFALRLLHPDTGSWTRSLAKQ